MINKHSFCVLLLISMVFIQPRKSSLSDFIDNITGNVIENIRTRIQEFFESIFGTDESGASRSIRRLGFNSDGGIIDFINELKGYDDAEVGRVGSISDLIDNIFGKDDEEVASFGDGDGIFDFLNDFFDNLDFDFDFGLGDLSIFESIQEFIESILDSIFGTNTEGSLLRRVGQVMLERVAVLRGFNVERSNRSSRVGMPLTKTKKLLKKLFGGSST